VNGFTIIVLDGTYTGNGNRDIDFNGKAITLQSQNGAGTCIIDCQGSYRGFYFHSGEGDDSVLDGFSVTQGYEYMGGGMYIENSEPTIKNCSFRYNLVHNEGGGIYITGGSPTIIKL